MGFVTSAVAVGDVFGFLLLPLLLACWRITQVVIAVDVIQFIAMFAMAAILQFGNPQVATFIICGYIPGTCFAVWFACSDTILSSALKGTAPESLQRLIVFSNNSSPVIGPYLGGIPFSNIGIVWISLINGTSFLAQISGMIKIISNFEIPHLKQTYLERMKAGFDSIIQKKVILGFMIFSMTL